MSNQQSNTRGKQSTAQKRDSARHDFGPIPSTTKVDGAAGGNQRTGRTITEVMDDLTEKTMIQNADDSKDEEEPQRRRRTCRKKMRNRTI